MLIDNRRAFSTACNCTGAGAVQATSSAQSAQSVLQCLSPVPCSALPASNCSAPRNLAAHARPP
jgi:hypothetical protein